MATATGLVLAAGGIALANDAVFSPALSGKPFEIVNWRIIPATAVLALTLGGLAELSPPLATSIAALVFLSVLILPSGNAPTPVDNAAKLFGNSPVK
jgi:hypothetical protein